MYFYEVFSFLRSNRSRCQSNTSLNPDKPVRVHHTLGFNYWEFYHELNKRLGGGIMVSGVDSGMGSPEYLRGVCEATFTVSVIMDFFKGSE